MAAVSEDKEDIQIDVQEGANSQHEPDPAPASTSSSAGSTKVFEGSNIHQDSAGRLLCSYSKKVCNSKRLEGYGFCRTHISEDPNSPFVQCTYVSKQTNRQCTHMVTKDTQPILCNTHKQPTTATKKSTRDPKKAKVTKETDSKAESQRKKFSAIMHKLNIAHSPYLAAKHSDGDESDSESSFGPDENNNSVSSNNAAEEAAARASAELLEKVLEDEDDDESSESDYFREAEVLAEEELLKRRKQKIKRLLKLYKAQYKRMRDLLVIRQKQVKKFQQRVSRASSQPLPATVPAPDAMESATSSDAALQLYYHSNKVALAQEGMLPLAKKAEKKEKEKEEKALAEKPVVVEKKFCAHSSCSVRALPLTNYCYAHILDDKDQKLFKRCSADQCSYPVLAASSASCCVLHTELAAKSEPEKKHPRKRKPTESELAESAVSPAAQALLSDINQIVKKVQTKRKRSSPAAAAPKIPFVPASSTSTSDSAGSGVTPPTVPQIFVPGAVTSPSTARSPVAMKTQP